MRQITDAIKRARTANIIDILRFAGCFCIVWYHSGYYWALSPEGQHTAHSAMLLGISWAMPFFYTTTAYFALEAAKSFRATADRILNIGLMLAAYTLLYYVFYHYPHFERIGLGDAVSIFVTGAGTPCYFLWHVIAIQLTAYLVCRASLFVPAGKPALFFEAALIVLSLATLPLADRFEQLHINTFCLIAPCLAFVQKRHERGCDKNPSKYFVFLFAFVQVALIDLWIFSADGQSWSWATPFVVVTLALGFISLLRSSKDSFGSDDRGSLWFSRAGALFSLGVFLLHQLGFSFVNRMLIGRLRNWHIGEMTSFVTINLAGFVVALAATMLLYRLFPASITIPRRRWLAKI